MDTKPLWIILRTVGLLAWGRLTFPRTEWGRLTFPRTEWGRVLTLPDGKRFTVFRQALVKGRAGQARGPGAVFRIRFRFTAGSPGLNRRLSLLPIPLIVGFPGFRTKIWTIQPETGEFQGLYEWDSVAAAEAYARSPAIRMMKKRAVPETVDQEIIPETEVAEYLDALARIIHEKHDD